MLTIPASRDIAVDCTEHVGGETVDDITKPLEEFGIEDDESLDTLKRVIVVNKNIGVKSRGHKAKFDDFEDISTESTVDELAETIRTKAQPLTP